MLLSSGLKPDPDPPSISSFDEVSGDDAQEEREAAFGEIRDTGIGFVEEAEDEATTINVLPGTLVTIIPAGEKAMSLCRV